MRSCGGLGDIINMRMIFQDIKKSYPYLHVTWALPDFYFTAADSHPFIDETLSNTQVDRANFLQVFDLTHACTRHEWSQGKQNTKNRSDIWANYIGLNLIHHDTFMPYFKSEQQFIIERLKNLGWNGEDRIVVLAPKSAIGFKNLNANQVAKIKDMCKKFFLVILHSQPIIDLLYLKIPMLTGLNLKQAFCAIDFADYVIATDTGLLHVAGAYNKPTLGIFSYTNGDVISRHYKTVKVLQGKHMHKGSLCGPCNNFGTCVVDKNEQAKPCMTNINEDAIEKGWLKMLEN